MLVQFNTQAVIRFLGYNLNEPVLDVGSFQLCNVRISKPGEARKQEHVPDTFKRCLRGQELVIFQRLDFVLGQIYYFLGIAVNTLDFGLERVV